MVSQDSNLVAVICKVLIIRKGLVASLVGNYSQKMWIAAALTLRNNCFVFDESQM